MLLDCAGFLCWVELHVLLCCASFRYMYILFCSSMACCVLFCFVVCFFLSDLFCFVVLSYLLLCHVCVFWVVGVVGPILISAFFAEEVTLVK